MTEIKETEKIEEITEIKVKEEIIEPQPVKNLSQEEEEFVAKYGSLKKKNPLLRTSLKGKKFDSADYFGNIKK